MIRAPGMIRRAALLSAALLLCALPARAELVDKVAAVVNKDIIALSEVQARAAPELQRAAQEPDPKKRSRLQDEAMQGALDTLIGEKLLEVQVREFALEATDADVDLALEDVKRQNNIDDAQFERLLAQEGQTLPAYRQYMKKYLARMKLINLKVRQKVKVSEEDLKAEYAKVSRLESADAEVHARHLLVQLPAKPTAEQIETARKKAVALSAEARQAGVDFVALAKEKSEGSSAPDGGDLGWFRRGVMVPEFEKVVFQMQPGDISEPVRTRFGWHVIKLEERRALAARPFEEMKEQLREKLLRDQLDRFTAQYIKELRTQAVVEVKL